jgi:hypothetical protein
VAKHRNAGKTVAEILKEKKAGIKAAALPSGSPSWDDILDTLWEEIDRRARRGLQGYRTIRKLLSDPEYNR